MVNDLSVLANSTLVSFTISHRCVCRHNNIFLEGKDIPQEISLPVAVEEGKLLLQQLEVRYYQWLLFAIVYNPFKNMQKNDQFI